jgi:hypothetical protein
VPTVPSVRLGRPKDAERYDTITVAGVKIYYKSSFKKNFESVTIKAEKLFFSKTLAVVSNDK